MSEMKNHTKIKGISVCNPIDPEKDYLLFTVDYAIKNGFNHMQVIGPIHHGIKGNIDGMTPYRKYSRFNSSKDQKYIEKTQEIVNLACKKAYNHGLKMYQWHHELELPAEFKEVYPEVVNSFGDIEVTHPLVKDFLENKILDFFEAYPLMDGIILTLHETKIPLLKLKDQKLGKLERIMYVTKILFDTCNGLGKELVVRPFASTEEDYVMMADAYKGISEKLLFMDKWTQFDWSLTLPHNAFFKKITNPLLVEADIFGEFFGKGHLPLMLKDHITKKFEYCETVLPKGYVARIDRAGEEPFGSVNEVNLHIMNACLNGQSPENVIGEFFQKKYPNAAKEVEELMESTEEILRKTIYANGYYYSELSRFPTLNHCKNHFYFEMMREDYNIASNEWFIPVNWSRGTIENLLQEKETAAKEAKILFDRLETIKDRIEECEYQKIWVKFANLKLVTEIWKNLTFVFKDYASYFEKFEEKYAEKLESDLKELLRLRDEGLALLGDDFYCVKGGGEHGIASDRKAFDYIGTFINEIRESIIIEKAAVLSFKEDLRLHDFIVCGGAMEGHRLQKEVNFSDTMVSFGKLCRIPGNKKGMDWSSINAHGWFSYELNILPDYENKIAFCMDNVEGVLEVKITVGDNEFLIHETSCETQEVVIPYRSSMDQDTVRVYVEKISNYTPLVSAIKVYK